MKAFLINGPPRSGKDTIADFVVGNDGSFAKAKLAAPIKRSLEAFFELTPDELHYFDNNINGSKNVKHDRFLGDSWREAQIKFSEKFVKKIYGKDAFAKILIESIKSFIKTNPQKNFIVADCGFKEEAEYLIEAFGRENVYLIKIERYGHDFSEDSRGYLDGEKLGIKEFTLKNGDKATFLKSGFKLIQELKTGVKQNG